MTWLDIAERAERAEGPDRELDAAVMRAMGADVWNHHDNSHIDAQIRNGLWKSAREKHPDFYPEGDLDLTWHWRIDHDSADLARSEYGEVPSLSASVDAVLALIESLPAIPSFVPGSPPSSGWKIGLYRGMTPTGQPYAYWEAMVRPHAGENSATAATPAIALLAAFARAMASLEEEASR